VASSQELLACTSNRRTVLLTFGYWKRNVDLIYHWDPFSKLEFTQWKNMDCPHIQKSVTQPLSGQNMAPVFWDTAELLMTDSLQSAKTTIDQYTEPTFKLLDVIEQKH